MTLKNRFIRSATWEGMAAEDGACTPKLVDTIARLAGGGVGLIITGHAYVIKQGQAGEQLPVGRRFQLCARCALDSGPSRHSASFGDAQQPRLSS